MTNSEEQPEVSYGLVMPFLSVASKGGPYEDDAYAAGWAMGALDARLGSPLRPLAVEETVRAADLAQADLVAMRHGYEVDATPSDDGEWMFCEFVTHDLEGPAVGGGE